MHMIVTARCFFWFASSPSAHRNDESGESQQALRFADLLRKPVFVCEASTGIVFSDLRRIVLGCDLWLKGWTNPL